MVRARISCDRELTFGEVLVRVRQNFKLAVHIDTAAVSAAGLHPGLIGHAVGIAARGYVRRCPERVVARADTPAL